jgi:hypothetical protein
MHAAPGGGFSLTGVLCKPRGRACMLPRVQRGCRSQQQGQGYMLAVTRTVMKPWKVKHVELRCAPP